MNNSSPEPRPAGTAMAPPAPACDPAPAACGRDHPGAKTILVVDDFASVRLYHVNLLRQLGHRALAAADGVEGLQLLQENPVDLVLLDMLMPRMDGCEFLAHLRARPGGADLPVLVITSEGTKDYEEKFRQAGATGFLVKPTLPDAMLRALRDFLP